MGPGQKFFDPGRVRSGQPFMVWVWIWKISAKNLKFSNFFPFTSKNYHWCRSKSICVKDRAASYFLRVKSIVGLGHLYSNSSHHSLKIKSGEQKFIKRNHQVSVKNHLLYRHFQQRICHFEATFCSLMACLNDIRDQRIKFFAILRTNPISLEINFLKKDEKNCVPF